MNKINLLPLVLFSCGVANAAETNDNPLYVGARLGATHYSNFSEKVDGDKNDLGAGIFIGHNFNSQIAIEAGYTDLGTYTIGNSDLEQETIDLVGKFNWKMNESLGTFAKLGGAYYTAEAQSLDDSGLIGTVGLGLEYAFNKAISARLEYQYYHDIELDDVDWNTHFYGVGLAYSWGADKAPMPKPLPVVIAPVIKPQPVVEVMPIKPQPVAPKPVQMIEIPPLTVELPFMTNSDKLPQSYLDQLAPIAQHLIEHPEARLYVVGHTDSRGSAAYNQKLSEQRAALIGNYLAVEFNIDLSRIVETGQGELQPRATNETPAGRALNRRVSVFTPGLKKVKK